MIFDGILTVTMMDDDYEWEEKCDDPTCSTCYGEGWVESVVDETNRWLWDRDAGECPNCHGTGLRRDQTYF